MEDETEDGEGEAGERSVLLALNCVPASPKRISLNSHATQLRTHLKRTQIFPLTKDFPAVRIRLLTKAKEASKV